MTKSYKKRLNELKVEAIAEDIDIEHCGDDIDCIEETIDRVRRERSGPTLSR